MLFSDSILKEKIDIKSRLILFVVALIVLRGLFIIVAGVSAPNIYILSSLLAMILASYSFFINVGWNRWYIDKQFQQLLRLNALCITLVIAFSLIINPKSSLVGYLYFSFLPFIIYLFIKIPEKYVIRLLLLITFIVAVYIIRDFIALNYGIGDKSKVLNEQNILREEGVLSRTIIDSSSFSFQPKGLFGDHHDSGNFMGLLSVFWLLLYSSSRNKNFIYLLFAIISVFALLFCQTAVNITMVILTIFVSYFKNLKKYIISLLLLFVAIVIVIIVLNTINIDLINALKIWTYRVNNTDSYGWKYMFHYGVREFPVSEIIHIFIGQARSTDAIIYKTEIGWLKHLYDLGILPFSILYLMLTYPLRKYLFLKGIKKEVLKPYVYAILFGVLSLAHYPSIFRMPTVIVYFLMFAMFFRLKYKILYH